MDADDIGDATRELVKAVRNLNAAVDAFTTATGLTAMLFVNGNDYGDRVGVRIDGNLIDANAQD